MMGVNYCDTEKEFDEEVQELEENPDFSLYGHYDMIQDFYHDMNEVGFTDEQIDQMTTNRYGDVIEIIEAPNLPYTVYIGAR